MALNFYEGKEGDTLVNLCDALPLPLFLGCKQDLTIMLFSRLTSSSCAR